MSAAEHNCRRFPRHARQRSSPLSTRQLNCMIWINPHEVTFSTVPDSEHFNLQPTNTTVNFCSRKYPRTHNYKCRAYLLTVDFPKTGHRQQTKSMNRVHSGIRHPIRNLANASCSPDRSSPNTSLSNRQNHTHRRDRSGIHLVSCHDWSETLNVER